MQTHSLFLHQISKQQSCRIYLDISMKIFLFFALCLFLQGVLGDLICEELPEEMCSFSIASNGKRCLLESHVSGEGNLEMECQTSEVFATNKMQEYIETDECIGACGVDRQSLGLSSDSLLDPKFIAKICSAQCYNNCPNIVDLYSNLASAEGVSLHGLCLRQKTRAHHGTSQPLSSGAAANAPVYAAAPVSAAAPPPSEY